ncbi:MAG: NAD+ synthase [Anaerolineae bacterium]|nr:NAD+ synthase [Anaerolineae bacterium]
MRITMAQFDPVVGDVTGNVARLAQALRDAAAERPDLLVVPEMFLTGYPPRDLLERDWFLARVREGVQQVRELSRRHPGTGILFGAPRPTGRTNGKPLFNAAVLVCDGEILAEAHKTLLPTYDVFDEARYFEPAPQVRPVPFKGEVLGLHICEDAWTEPGFWARRQLYDCDPVQELASQGATLLINISASPFNVGKERARYQLVAQHARRYGLPFVYVNQVGGNDELVFDGRSFVLDKLGRPVAVLAAFGQEMRTLDTTDSGSQSAYQPQEEIASVHDALVLGLRDYMHKCGFAKAVIGLSGGIDSAVTCVLAARALGPENVLGVSMPSPYSSPGSIADARQLAANLGIAFRVIGITEIHNAYLQTLAEPFSGAEPNVAEENIQARIRGNILMALSNKFGHLVLSTGNKSELAVGYCTLYGDMSGGLAVISDVPKMMVYELAHYMNRVARESGQGEVVPQASIDKPPSAELKPDQVDQDTLPPYPILDAILQYYVEEGWSVEQIAAEGYEEATVRWVVRTVNRNEYKRRQAAPGLRVTTKAFGVGRRMPIAARY